MINLLKPIRLAAGCKRSPGLVAFAVCLGLSTNAAAVSTFPMEIQKHLSLYYTPPCIICHDKPLGGLGTATTKFAGSMKAAGLTVDTATVGPALDTLNKNQTDSDGDGTPDIRALQAGLDPSTGGANFPAERYGCGARISTGPLRQRGVVSLAWLTFSIGLLVHRHRLLRRSRPGR